MSKDKDKVEEKANEIVDELGKYTDEKVGKLESKMDKMAEMLEKYGKEKEEEKGKLYSPSFKKSDVQKMGWKEKGFHFLRSVVYGKEEQAKLLTGTDDASGGYLVPEEYLAEIMTRSRDRAVIKQRARVIPMTSPTLNLSTEYGNPDVFYTAEGATKTTTSATVDRTTLNLKKLAAIIRVTDELQDDANVDIIDYVTDRLVDAVVEKEEEMFITGTGTTMPKGLNHYALESVDAGGDLVFGDIVDAKFKLSQRYRNNAVWIAHKDVIAEIQQLTDDSDRPLILSNMGEATSEVLLGSPILENNNVPTDKIFFGDLSYYVIGEGREMRIDSTNTGVVGGQSDWERDTTSLRIVKRHDAALPLTEAFVEIENV